MTPAFLILVALVASQEKTFKAGVSDVDITPESFPVLVNGSFGARKGVRATDRLAARALVLDDGKVRVAICVVDSLMLPAPLLDRAKRAAAAKTGIPADRMLISATHTHSAPSAMGCLGTEADPGYPAFLERRLVHALVEADAGRAPARIGWASVKGVPLNHCRRWILRPDRVGTDPFGDRTVRANMHPGYMSRNHVGPAGPADREFFVVAIQNPDGVPMAVLANFAMHYKGAPPVSGDCCGRFGPAFGKRIGAGSRFVAMLSQGTSGDSMWMDYGKPRNDPGLDGYVAALVDAAHEVYRSIRYRDHVTLAMAEARLKLRRRTPDQERLAWARKVFPNDLSASPRGRPQIYAREALFLHAEPEAELVLQAMRIGDLGITALPNEVYGITGLKLKRASPLDATFNIELANGAEGYIPPPEQHDLGGYTTWPARTAGLEDGAEPKIVEALLRLLEKISGRERRDLGAPETPYSSAVMASRPSAFWRLQEMQGRSAADRAGGDPARYERGIAYWLPGPAPDSRAAHFAGGRLTGRVAGLGSEYTVEAWIWNGIDVTARPVTGYVFSRGEDGVRGAPGDHLGIGGTHQPGMAGRLIFFNGNERNDLLVGKTTLETKRWYHVACVRSGEDVRVFLDGVPEIEGRVPVGHPPGVDRVFVGGRSDGFASFEGRVAEAAVYSRALSAEDLQAHLGAR